MSNVNGYKHLHYVNAVSNVLFFIIHICKWGLLSLISELVVTLNY